MNVSMVAYKRLGFELIRRWGDAVEHPNADTCIVSCFPGLKLRLCLEVFSEHFNVAKLIVNSSVDFGQR